MARPYSAAERLDAADGVIDGKFYGRQIVESAPASRVVYGGTRGFSAAERLDAADGVIDGKYYGRQIVEGGPSRVAYGGSYGTATYGRGLSAAERLDAADGVIDGKFYGRQIVEGGPSRVAYGGSYGTSTYGRGLTAAERLDAADGVVDGKYYGRQIVEGAPRYGYSGSYGTTYGGYYGGASAYPSTYGGTIVRGQTAAERLDAADGVIDGKFYGREIVGGGGYSDGYRYPVGGRRVVYGGGYSDYGGYAPTTYSSYGTRGLSAAERLDAADGVIDGKFYGRQIVEGGPSRVAYGGSYGTATYGRGLTAAERLDAADGVIDGKYYGSQIVEGGYGGGYAGAGGYSTYGTQYGTVPATRLVRTTRPVSAAERLDAADGVIDGKFYGRQIVGGGASHVSYGRPMSAAERLDAADGVMDGKFHGRQIVETRRV